MGGATVFLRNAQPDFLPWLRLQAARQDATGCLARVLTRLEQRHGVCPGPATLYRHAVAAAGRQPWLLVDSIQVTRKAVALTALNQAMIAWRAAQDQAAVTAGMSRPPRPPRVARRCRQPGERRSGALREQLQAILTEAAAAVPVQALLAHTGRSPGDVHRALRRLQAAGEATPVAGARWQAVRAATDQTRQLSDAAD